MYLALNEVLASFSLLSDRPWARQQPPEHSVPTQIIARAFVVHAAASESSSMNHEPVNSLRQKGLLNRTDTRR